MGGRAWSVLFVRGERRLVEGEAFEDLTGGLTSNEQRHRHTKSRSPGRRVSVLMRFSRSLTLAHCYEKRKKPWRGPASSGFMIRDTQKKVKYKHIVKVKRPGLSISAAMWIRCSALTGGSNHFSDQIFKIFLTKSINTRTVDGKCRLETCGSLVSITGEDKMFSKLINTFRCLLFSFFENSSLSFTFIHCLSVKYSQQLKSHRYR